MQIASDITLQELLERAQISHRTYNALLRAGMVTMKDVRNFAEPPARLMELKGLGQKSYTELEPLLDDGQLDSAARIHEKAEAKFALLGDAIGSMLTEAYNALPTEDNKVTKFFKTRYPSVKELHSAVMGKGIRIMKTARELSMDENIELRRMYARYLEDATSRMADAEKSDLDTYQKYSSTLNELQDRLEEFSYRDKAECFISKVARDYFQLVYEQMRETQLDTLSKNFTRRRAPEFENLAQYFDAPQSEYRKLCPGQSMTKTLVRLYIFNQKLKEIFDRDWQKSDDELRLGMVKIEYPYLDDEQSVLVMEHWRDYGTLPMFFLVYNYLRVSKGRKDKIFCLRFGIFDEKERILDEVSLSMGRSRERIRQISLERLDIHKTKLLEQGAWTSYINLLSLPYVTAETEEYQLVKKREHLSYDFRVFARLMMLAGERDFSRLAEDSNGNLEFRKFRQQYETEFVGDVAIVINRKVMPSINFRKCVDTLEAMISSRHSSDMLISVEELLNKMPDKEHEEAVKLMLYVVKNVLNLEVVDGNRIIIKKNYIDVAEELYGFLAQKGEPMSLRELFVAFKEKYPDHRYTDAKSILHYLLHHPGIKPIGKTSHYGLDTWNKYYGTIRGLLLDMLEASNEPVHIDVLHSHVTKHFPNASSSSVSTTMQNDVKRRFVQFEDRYFGLRAKVYDEKWKKYESPRQSFDDRLSVFRNFVDTHERFPINGSNEEEAAMCRWLNNSHHGHLKEKDREQLEATLKGYEEKFIPRTYSETKCRDKCREYKEYVESHGSLPTATEGRELYTWLIRSRKNYSSYLDYKREYLTDLFEYITNSGFELPSEA